MASSLFGNNDMSSRIDSLRQMVGDNPDAFMQRMMQTNPQFAEFVNTNRGKTPEQIAADYGLDINPLRKFF
jgi:hypothetical protein